MVNRSRTAELKDLGLTKKVWEWSIFRIISKSTIEGHNQSDREEQMTLSQVRFMNVIKGSQPLPLTLGNNTTSGRQHSVQGKTAGSLEDCEF